MTKHICDMCGKELIENSEQLQITYIIRRHGSDETLRAVWGDSCPACAISIEKGVQRAMKHHCAQANISEKALIEGEDIPF